MKNVSLLFVLIFTYGVGSCLALSVDINGDGAMDAADAAIVFAAWGTDGAATGADLNNDGIVDAGDFDIVFAAWTGDGHLPAAGDANASYHTNGTITINATEVINVFVESSSGILTPGGADAVPAGTLLTDNASRVGITGFTGITVEGWRSHNTAIPFDDVCGELSLVVGPALGVPAIVYPIGSSNFEFIPCAIPEPASASLLSIAFAGLLATRRR